MDNLMQNIVDIAKEHRLDVSAAMDYALSSSVSYTMIVIREHDGSVSKLTIATPHVSRFVMDFRSNIEAKKAA